MPLSHDKTLGLKWDRCTFSARASAGIHRKPQNGSGRQRIRTTPTGNTAWVCYMKSVVECLWIRQRPFVCTSLLLAKATLMPSMIWGQSMNKAEASRRTRLQLASGIFKRRSTARKKPNIKRPNCTNGVEESSKTMRKPSSGIRQRQRMAIPKPNSSWDGCMSRVSECHKATPKLSSGTARRSKMGMLKLSSRFVRSRNDLKFGKYPAARFAKEPHYDSKPFGHSSRLRKNHSGA